jgi:hypothetical protein
MVTNIEEQDYYNLRIAAKYYNVVKMSYDCFDKLKQYMDSFSIKNKKILSSDGKKLMNIRFYFDDENIQDICFGKIDYKKFSCEWIDVINIKDLSRYLKLKALW